MTTTLTTRDLRIIREALGLLGAGAFDGNRADLDSVTAKVDQITAGRQHVVALSKKELFLLNHGLGAGISDDGIESIGLTKREQRTLGRVGNLLLDLGRSTMPRYYD